MDDHKKRNAVLIFSIILFIVVSLFVISIVRNTSKETSEFATEMQQIQSQSTNDTVNSIEEDVNNTDFEGVDKDLQNIDQELNQGY